MERASRGVLPTLLLITLLPPVTPAPCPRPCSCPQPSELHCTFRSLLSIPAVPKHLERINLGFNSINQIRGESLSGLRKLELLMIHGNNIPSLPDGVFRDLKSLQMLKFSYNKLKELRRHSLQGLWSLVRLHLDHNQLDFIHPDTFQGLTSLRLLQLEGNRLQQLHPATFTTFSVLSHFHFSTLRHLFLSDNRLVSLPSGLLSAMPKLENLYLHGNPWTCDCNMRWLLDWEKTSPGVLKCRKDASLPGGKLCPVCSSPRHLHSTELRAVGTLVCQSPAISSPQTTTSLDETERDVLNYEKFKEPIGNVSLDLSDEHGNKVGLECSVGEPKDLHKINWEQVNQRHLVTNITFSVELQCQVDREKYQQLWRLIAYYSSVPAHLKRGSILSKTPHPAYTYQQDSVQEAQYYTGVRVNMMAQPAWLMQPNIDVQLNRLQSSAKTVRLILGTELSEVVDTELEQNRRRMWVMIDSTNRTQKAMSVVVGGSCEMHCDVHSSEQPVIQWMLPDGSKLNSTHKRPNNRISVSREGRLFIKTANHRDTGSYFCISWVHGDLAVLPFFLTVQESSRPPPVEDTREDTAITSAAGSPFTLDCTASGSPDPEINWIPPSNTIVSFQTNSSKVVVYPNGTLYIPQIQVSDSGYYRCVAINQHGVATQNKKVTVVKRKGLNRPLSKFPLGPQSASGVNTQIKVLPVDLDEASGDIKMTQDGPPVSRVDPARRRSSGGGVSSRRGILPPRNRWRGPPVLRKPVGSEDRKGTAGDMRRFHLSKSKIDPEKWADILGKIRDRKPEKSVTPVPVQYTTKLIKPPNAKEEVPHKVSDPETESQHGLATQEHTQHQHNAHSQTPPSYTVPDADGFTLSTKHTDILPSTQSVHLLSEPTSAPLHVITSRHENADTLSRNRTFFQQENHRACTDANRENAADQSLSPSVTPLYSATTEEKIRKSFHKASTPSEFHVQPKNTKLRDLQTESSSTTPAPISQRKSEKHLAPSLRKANSRKRNGSRKKKPNRRKHKLKKNTRLFSTSSRITPSPMATTFSSTELKIEASGVIVRFSTTVPFTKGQEALSSRMSHEESTVSMLDQEEGTSLTSLPASLSDTKDSHHALNKPSAAPTASPLVDTTTSHTTSQGESTPDISQKLTVSPKPPLLEKPSDNTPSTAADPRLHSDNVFREFQTVTRSPTDFKFNLGVHQYKFIEKGGNMLWKETEPGSSLLPPPFTPSPFFIERGISTASGKTSAGSPKTQSKLFEQALGTDIVPTTMPQKLFHSSVQTEITGTEAKWDFKNNQNIIDAPTTINTEPTASSATSLTHVPVTPTGVMLHVTKPPELGAKMTPSPWDQNTRHTITTSEQNQTTNLQPTASPIEKPARTDPAFPDVNLHSRQMSSSIPTATAAQSKQSREALSSGTKDRATGHQLPLQGLVPKGKPKKTKNNHQMITVKAETDAQLPCEVQGQPTRFLSWTSDAIGVRFAINTMTQRFEVHPNGTLIIRKSQLSDAGQYSCTVQKEHGTEKMTVDLVVLSQSPRVLEPPHRDVTVDLGGTVELECKVDSHEVTWVLPSQVQMIAGQANGHVQQRVRVNDNGTLWISQASLTDTGTYRCTGNRVAGSDAVSVRLHVSARPPEIQQRKHENMTLMEGSFAYITCTATGIPQPIIHWTTPDGLKLSSSQTISGQNLIVFPNGTLHIQRLSPRNSGRYECLARNTISSSHRTVMLSVRRLLFSAKAMITSSSPQKTDVIYGRTLLLNCEAIGHPEPRILWRTPSKKLVDAQYSFDSRIKVLLNGSITIHSVTENDGGDYLCVARNKMGDDNVQLRVNVLTRPAKIERKDESFSQEVVHGKDLRVDCVASGLPNPEISWALPDGTMVNPVKRSRRYVVFDNGTLYFNDVGVPEEGDYTCFAENQLGKDEMKVRVRVKMDMSPPLIQGKNQLPVRVFHGQTVTLQCNAKGDPIPTITWMSPTNRLILPSLDKYQILKDGTLVVQKVQRYDGGNYTCIARNSVGQDHKVARLEILITPPVFSDQRGAARSVTAVQGQRMLLDCTAKGTPTPHITWILPGNVNLPAPYYSTRRTVHQNGTLEIQFPQKTDSGQLTCVAHNDGGEVRMSVNLEVKEAVGRPQTRPSVTDNVSLRLGSTVTLNCSFEGLKLPRPTWILPDGTPLHTGAQYYKFFHRSDGSLIISHPTVAEAGMYRCLGHSPTGVMERTVTLSPGRKPEIKNRYTFPINIMNGETLFLHCQTTGEPLSLTWTLPSGVVLNRQQRAGRYEILHNGTLAIRQVSVYDRGPYVCRAANEYGSSLLSAAVTVIARPPRITISPPSVMYVKHGVAVQLNCVATGTPNVEVAWETPEKTRLAVSAQPRLFGNKYVHPQGSLIIQSPTQRDAGVYRCTARNIIGTDSRSTTLNVF
ncbi:matrix-remodeling-associated protein 5 [Nothobranchius furzeri]|uniref:Matrix-remodelling associated 5 n=2 Tax=Nothobranchius TaxID=28779 RepID=A0A9D3BGW3_NOTFU|nr:matrix-remodelling associated 5 [Nothobranchius furzeri]